MKKRTLTIVLLCGLLIAAGVNPLRAGNVQAYSGFPTISITTVVPDQKVTIQINNFPAGVNFAVTMGPIGSRGVGGTAVGTLYSGAGGTLVDTYSIPASLRGSSAIAIRLQSSNGFFAYNWFTNAGTEAIPATGPTATAQPSGSPTSGSTTIPTFSIDSVEQDATVTILTNNFPANDTFTVTMGVGGTRGINGIVVGTTASGSGGQFLVSFDIPEELKGARIIAIRLESPTTGYFAYNWFYNTSATSSTPEPVPPTGSTATPSPSPSSTASANIPTFTITSVVRGSKVTIQTHNFPAGKSFNVLMGPMGTHGVGGTTAGTINSDQGGTLNATFDIPAALQEASLVAIRLESPQSGYFAYNWFYNQTTSED